MLTLSKSEINFISKAIKNNTRMDLREINEKRDQKITENEKFASSLVDRSVLIERGHSKLNLSISFRSSLNTLKILELKMTNKEELKDCNNEELKTIKITNKNDITEELKTINHSLNYSNNPALKKIEDLLESFNIGIYIEVYIIKNDGNIYDMIIDGLKYIFSSIKIPNILRLEECYNCSINIPECKSYAIYGTELILDPTILEESSSEGIIRIFEGEERSIISEGSIDFNNFTLINDLI